MESVTRVFLIAAAMLAVVGGAILLTAKFGLSRLPGDIVIRRDDVTIYIPLGLMIALSVIGSLVLSLLRHL
ncbi:MAG: DUF2905 domain-containing protein [Solirubrobacteraceae bacterium]